MSETEEAIKYAKQALSLAEKYNQASIKLNIYPLIISLYQKNNNFKKASEYQSNYIHFYKLKQKEKNRIIQQYILSKEDKIITQLEADRKKLQKTNRLMYISIAALLILLAVSIFLANPFFLLFIISNTKNKSTKTA